MQATAELVVTTVCLCVLYSVFLTKVLTTLRCLYFPGRRFDVANHSSVWCKLLQYLSDLFADYSTCLILAFTVERCIAAYLPTQFKRVSRNTVDTE